MALAWIRDGEGLYTATAALDGGGWAYLTVEELCGIGWDWQVWDAAHEARLHYGLADSREQAKTRAEQAFARLERELAG